MASPEFQATKKDAIPNATLTGIDRSTLRLTAASWSDRIKCERVVAAPFAPRDKGRPAPTMR
ncbi:hypothetical protein [Methylopila sp. 73B]|uniref:hypothetical protein n=1 Tax=Methylopila sp. 73B TaxID=1120792 RepID=UPI001FD8C46B|nr:hypothetical protein [Methylopila sp. 73B]